MGERRVYAASFKLEAIRLAQPPERTTAQAADELGIGRSTLTHWLREYRDKGGAAFPGHGRPALTPQQAEMQRLKRELEIIRQKRDTLELPHFGGHLNA
jgi:transposase-like protein